MSWKQSYNQRRAHAAKRQAEEESVALLARIELSRNGPSGEPYQPTAFKKLPRVQNLRVHSYISEEVGDPCGFSIISRKLKQPLVSGLSYVEAQQLQSRFEQARGGLKSKSA